jgi:hypothetical protein
LVVDPGRQDLEHERLALVSAVNAKANTNANVFRSAEERHVVAAQKYATVSLAPVRQKRPV